MSPQYGKFKFETEDGIRVTMTDVKTGKEVCPNCGGLEVVILRAPAGSGLEDEIVPCAACANRKDEECSSPE